MYGKVDFVDDDRNNLFINVRRFSDTKFTLIANICSSNPIDFHHWFSTQSRARIVSLSIVSNNARAQFYKIMNSTMSK